MTLNNNISNKDGINEHGSFKNTQPQLNIPHDSHFLDDSLNKLQNQDNEFSYHQINSNSPIEIQNNQNSRNPQKHSNNQNKELKENIVTQDKIQTNTRHQVSGSIPIRSNPIKRLKQPETISNNQIQFTFRNQIYTIISYPTCENNHEIDDPNSTYIMGRDGKVFCDSCYLINSKRESLIESLKEGNSQDDDVSSLSPNSPQSLSPNSPDGIRSRKKNRRSQKLKYSLVFSNLTAFLNYINGRLEEEYKLKENRAFIEYAQDFSRLIKQVIDFVDHWNGKCNTMRNSGKDFFCRDCEVIKNLTQDIMESILYDFHQEQLYILAIQCYLFGTGSYYKLNKFENGLVCLKFAFEARRKLKSIIIKSNNQDYTINDENPQFLYPEQFFRNFLKIQEAKMDAMMCIGYGRKGKIEKSLDYAKKVIDNIIEWKDNGTPDPYIFDAIYLGGMMQWKHKKDLSQAIIWLDIGMSLFGEDSDTVRFLEMATGLIYVLLEKGDFERAISFYNNIMKQNEEDINNLIETHTDASYVRNFITCVNRLLALEKLKDLNLGFLPKIPMKEYQKNPLSLREPPENKSDQINDNNSEVSEIGDDQNFMKEIESTVIIFNNLYFEAMEISTSSKQRDDMLINVCKTGEILLHQFRSSDESSIFDSESEIIQKMQIYKIIILHHTVLKLAIGNLFFCGFLCHENK